MRNCLIGCFFSLWYSLFANPEGGVVHSGSATFSSQGETLTITTSQKAVIHWDHFSIHAGETTHFLQPDASSIVVNRVNSGNPSALLGTLEATGRVFLINPSGILVGEGAYINAASFIASSLDALDEDFFRGEELLFSGTSTASVVNLGTIHAHTGDILLIGSQVENRGTLQSPHGMAALGSGREILLKPPGSERLFIRPDINSGNSEHSGAIEALQVELKAAVSPHALAIRKGSGEEASTMLKQDGKVFLVASSISSPGGVVHISGEEVHLSDQTHITVSHENQAGSLFLHAENLVTISPDSIISADSLLAGNGGQVTVFSEKAAGFYGTISAKGGQERGDGGFVEVSGKDYLDFRGQVSTLAPHGQVGRLLLDPSNINIQANGGANSNMMLGGGTYTATAATGVIDNGVLVGNLATTDITISTASAFGNPGIITVVDDVIWNAPHTLTFTADDHIQVNAQVTALDNSFTAATNVITLNAPEVQIGLSTQLNPNTVQTQSGSILVNSPTSYAIFGGNSATSDAKIATIGAGNIVINSGSVLFRGGTGAVARALLSTVTGNIDVTTTNDCNLNGGNGALSTALIQTGTGTITTLISGDLNLTPFVGNFFSSSIESTSGNIINTIGGNLSISSGTTAGSSAHIQTGGTGTITCSVTGDFSLVGGINTSSDALIQTSSGDITMTVGGEIQVTGDISAAAIQTIGGGDVQLNASGLGGDCIVSGGSGLQSYGRIATLTGGAITINLLGNYLFAAGASGGGGNASAGIFAALNSGSGSINLTGVNYTLNGITGGSTGANHAQISTLSGDITASASGNIALNGGIQANNLARILTSSGNISLTAALNCTLTGAVGPATAIIQAQNNLTALAGINLTVGAFSSMISDAGSLTLVVDNQFPTSPGIGPGAFSLASSGSLQTSGSNPLRIFTAKREQNSINALINGVVFVPGEEFVDSNQERWGVYYSNAFFGGPGFTLFYKNAKVIPPPLPLPVEASTKKPMLSPRLFTDLQVYDEFLRWTEQFKIADENFAIKRKCHYTKCICPRGLK